MLSVDVRCRIDPKATGDAAEVIQSIGLTVSDAIPSFLACVASEGAIPLGLWVPRAKIVAAIAELESPHSRSKLKCHENIETMHQALNRK